jgi:hypothetical protein
LADSTHTRPAFRRQLAAALILACAAGLMLGAQPVRADGDPASDVLASQSLFVPADGSIPAPEQQRLSGLLTAAARRGYPVRVALIATPADLGSIGPLWHHPGSYARFLGQELSLVYPGTLLVVMPNGLGVSRGGHPLPAPAAATGPGSGSGLATAALSAVQSLAARAGQRLAIPPVASSPEPSGAASEGFGAWLAIAVGLVVIAVAWAVSLRRRPPGRGGDDQPRRADTSTVS